VNPKLANLLDGVEAVFFDLFDTLVEVVPDRLPARAIDRGTVPSTVPLLLEELRATRVAPPGLTLDRLHDAFRRVTDALIAEKEASGDEIPAQTRFERILVAAGIRLAASDAVRVAGRLVAVHMGAIAAAVRKVDGAVRLFEQLQDARLRVALVSNLDHAPAAAWVLDRTGLAAYLPPAMRVVSEEVGARKPDGRIFREALARVGVASPRAALHIGDDPIADACGAGRAGIRAVWINREGVAWPRPDDPPPDLVVGHLADLLA